MIKKAKYSSDWQDTYKYIDERDYQFDTNQPQHRKLKRQTKSVSSSSKKRPTHLSRVRPKTHQ